MHNPIFTDIKWGSLSYADDGAVEYTLTIAYDWAEFYVGGQISAGDLKIKDSMRTSGRVADLIKTTTPTLLVLILDLVTLRDSPLKASQLEV